jgi:TP901 family phage tail tape measure protein
MPKEKKIVVGLELKDKKFLTGLSQINKSVQDVGKTVKKIITETGGDFATLSGKIDQTKGAINRGNTTMTTMVKVLREIRTHLADLKGSVGTTNTALDTLNKTAGRTETGIKQIKGAVNQVSTEVKQFGTSVNATIASTNQLANANMQVAQSFNAVGQAAQTSSSTGLANVQNAYDRLKSSGRNALGSISSGGVGEFLDVFNPARVAKAAGWNLAYKIADAPMRAFQGIASGAKQAIDNASQLEGTMFDLQAYLGGAAQDEFQKLAKTMGKTGTDEQLNDAGLEVLQKKILTIGQQSTFTAAQIAEAAQNAAKAGVSLEEIAGEGGTALESISYLAQNTGESLESSATQVAKLQALFESNLAKSQQAMGQSVHAGRQYQLIVDGLATADMSSAASAKELTEALFNVGGSASNLNISFFETMSLVSQMVPAFESAASAGTSLKYVFSGISGGRSVKAKGAMQRFNLMDESGQSVFFGKNEETGKTEFKGIEFMTEKLREVFGDESGMAVDVRNRVITDIFGQDALKAVSRMVSMTDEQAQEMYKMAADMTSNAASGVQAAQNLAMIKNEGLEYDIEYFKGTIDALQTTLTMPLMKPMSNFVKTFSSIGDAAFAVLTDAKDADETIKTIKTEFMGTSLLPGAEALMDTAVKFARTLGGVLKVITEEGYSISSVSKAIATLFGGSKNEISARAAEFEGLLKRTYAGLEKFVKTVPSMLEKLAKGGLWAFDALIRALTWIAENWETVYKGLMTVISALIVSKVVSFTTEIGNMGIALFDMAKGAKAAGGWLATIAGINTGNAGGITQLVQGAAGKLSGAAGASAIPTMSGVGSTAAAGVTAAAAGTTAAASSIPIMTRLMGLWTSFATAVGSAWASLGSFSGLLTLVSRAIGFLISPFVLLTAAIVSFYVTWQNNTAGMTDFLTEKFGNTFQYILQTVSMFGSGFLPIWTAITTAFSDISKSTFMDGLANIFKAAGTILEGAVLIIGGTLKLIVGIFTGNFDLIKSGGADFLYGIGSVLQGAVGAIMGALQGVVNGAIDLLNSLFRLVGIKEIDNKRFTSDMTKGTDVVLKAGGAKAATNFASGLSAGLKNSGPIVALAARTLVKNHMLDVVDDTQDSHSDSKKAIEDGENFGSGYATGLNNSTDLVASAAENLVNAAREPFINAAGFDFKGVYANALTAQVNSLVNKSSTSSLAISSEIYKQNPQTISSSASPAKGFGPGYTLTGNPIVDAKSIGTLSFGPQAAGELARIAYAEAKSTGVDKETAFEKDSLDTLMNSKKLQEIFARDNQGRTLSREDVKQLLTQSGFGARSTKEQLSSLIQDMGFESVAAYSASSDFYEADKARRLNAYGPQAVGTIVQKDIAANKKMAQVSLKANLKQSQWLKQAEAHLSLMAASSRPDDMNKVRYEGQGKYAGDVPYYLLDSKPSWLPDTDIKPSYANRNINIQAINEENKNKIFDKTRNKFIASVEDVNKHLKLVGPAFAAAAQDFAGKAAANFALAKPSGADDITRYTGGAANQFGPYSTYTPPDTSVYRTGYVTPYGEMQNAPFQQYLGLGNYLNMAGNPIMGIVERLVETSYETKNLTPDEIKGNNAKLDFVPVKQLPQMASFFTDSIIPESYDGPNGMVSPDIAAYKQLYGSAGIEHQGLSKLFQSTPALADQYAQVGNRAATFLSMKQGKLTPEDYKTFQELLALDQKDKDNFLAASKTLAAEQNKITSDPALTQEQKNTKIAGLQSDFTYNNRAMAGSYRDVLGVKVGGLADYDTAISEGKISEQAKPYTDTAFQRVREAYANALDPKNQSEAFKKLSPEEQDRIKKAALELPLQTQAYYNSAIADGVITDTERKLLEQYSGADAIAVAELIASATLPTQDQLNAAYKPYVDGTATVTAASNITGVAAPAYLDGLGAIISAAGLKHGQEYAAALSQGVAFDKDGNAFNLGDVVIQDAVNLSPEVVKAQGILIGESLPEGIAEGVASGMTVVTAKITKTFENSRLVSVVRELYDIKSPSGVFEREIGLPIALGVAKGIENGKESVIVAMQKILNPSNFLSKGGPEGMGGVGSQGAEAAAAGTQTQTVSPYFLMGQSASKDFVRGFVNAEDPINAFSVALMTAISNPFNPQSMESSVLTMFAKVIDFGKKIGRVLIDDGFTPVIDGKTEEPWTFATVVGLALAHTVGDEEGKWRPQAEALGKSISLGIAAGIADGEAVGKMIANVEAAVQAALDAGQVKINANSPSRLFADKIGSPITEGIARGITDSSYMLDSAMGGLMDGATRNYRPDISPVALAGQRQAQINAQNTYNYNLGIHTSQNPQVVQRSFAVMQSFTGES